MKRTGLTLLLVLASGTARAEPEHVATFTATAGEHGLFGFGIAASDEVIVIGQPGARKVYIYERAGDDWPLTGVLRHATRGFGTDVSTDGDLVVVGAPGNGGGGARSGGAYVYRRDGAGAWAAVQQLVPEDNDSADELSPNLVCNGRIVLAAPRTNADGTVYVFQHDGGRWIETQKITNHPAHAHTFGSKMHCEGDTLVVCDPGDSEHEPAGAVFVYEWSDDRYVRTQKLGGRRDGAVGSLARLSGRRLVMAGGNTERALRIYGRTPDGTFAFIEEIPTSLPSNDPFGPGDVAFHGDIIALGVPGANGIADQSGRAFVYQRASTGWTEARELQPAIDPVYGHMGHSMIVRAEFVLVGMPWRHVFDVPDFLGSVFMFRLEAPKSPVDAGVVSDAGAVTNAGRQRVAPTSAGEGCTCTSARDTTALSWVLLLLVFGVRRPPG